MFSLLTILLFVRCSKDDLVENNEERLVPVSFELSLDPDSKSYFGDLLPFGNIKWGNENNIEYAYLSVPYRLGYYISGEIRIYGELIEMKAEVDTFADKVIFRGEAQCNNLQNTKDYYLYYFGNDGQGGSNTNISNYRFTNLLIGKKISFAKQTGDINELGKYHLAKIKVDAQPIYDADSVVQSFVLHAKELQNINSIAKLDLTDETKLSGTATEIQSFTVLWNVDTRSFDEIYETVSNSSIDISNNAGANSYISLLPNSNSVYLECSKGRVEFPNCIESNHLYIGGNADDINDALPLKWE